MALRSLGKGLLADERLLADDPWAITWGERLNEQYWKDAVSPSLYGQK